MRQRAIAIGKFIVYAALFYSLLLFFGWIVSRFAKPPRELVWQALSGNLQAASAGVAATILLAWLERRSFWCFGLGGPNRLRNFATGLITGAVLLSAMLGLMSIRGLISFRGSIMSARSIAYYGAAYLILFLVVGLSEELLWRGYALVTLSTAISFWPATVTTSLIFGASHLRHSDETYRGAVFAVLFAIVLGYSFLRTGSLWFAVGVHATWDYCQSFVYGVANSGVRVPGSLNGSTLSGPHWLSGGSAGPEGSVLMAPVLLGLVLIIRFVLWRGDSLLAGQCVRAPVSRG